MLATPQSYRSPQTVSGPTHGRMCVLEFLDSHSAAIDAVAPGRPKRRYPAGTLGRSTASPSDGVAGGSACGTARMRRRQSTAPTPSGVACLSAVVVSVVPVTVPRSP